MGWISRPHLRQSDLTYDDDSKGVSDQVQDRRLCANEDGHYPLIARNIPTDELPFIPAEEVKARDGRQMSRICTSSNLSCTVAKPY